MIFIQEKPENIFELSTFDYGGHLFRKNLIILDLFYANSSFAKNANLFPDKLVNSHQFEVKISGYNYAPYCKFTDVIAGSGNADLYSSPHGSKDVDFDGIDGIIMTEFCLLRNCCLDVKSFGDGNWGNIYTDGTAQGAISSVWHNKADFTTCSYYNWYNDKLDASQQAIRSAIRILVPKSDRLPPALTPVYPFKKETWMGLLIWLIIVIIAYHCITMAALKRKIYFCFFDSLFNIFAIYTEQSFRNRSNKVAYRIFLGILLTSGLMLSYTYTGELSSVLAVPKFKKPINTVKEFCESPYLWGNPSYAWIQSFVGTNKTEDKILVKKFQMIQSSSVLHAKTMSGNFGIGIEELNAKEFSFGKYLMMDNLKKLHLIKEPIFESYIVSFSRRGWPMLEKYNEFILQATQHGLLDCWQRQSVRKFLNPAVQFTLELYEKGFMDTPETMPLTLTHVIGPILLIAIGGGIAAFVFILEIIVGRKGGTKYNGIKRKFAICGR